MTPDFRRGACYRFTLKRRPLDLRLRSRSAVPSEAGIGPDLRRLGVGLHEIQLAQRGTLRHLPIDHPALGDGLHPPDPAGGPRWTMGSARFDTTRLRLDRGPLRVQVTVTPLAFYPVS